MGYRLKIYRADYACCGGKLFGYISEEDLPKCKSWVWLNKHGYLYEEDKYCWDYCIEHTTMLYGDDYREFMDLYIKDYKKFGYNNPETIKELTDSIDKTNDSDVMIIRWV